MVVFKSLIIRNFKRFAGEHRITLQGDGRVTVIAAQNGLGKTTLMEAIHVSLYGKKGFSYLYPERKYLDWIYKAYSVDADDSEKVLLSLEMEDPVLGLINISRTFWILDDEGTIEEETGLTIRGKPIQTFPGETRKGLADRWIEDYLPHAAMRRFLVDGERLSHLDPKRIDDEIVRGIDDATGIGLLHRLKFHLDLSTRATLRALAPKDQAENIAALLRMQEELKKGMEETQIAMDECSSLMQLRSERIVEIQKEIEDLTRDDGSEKVQLRMDYAIKQSEVTSSRKELHELLQESLPFVIAGLPSDLSEWDIDETLNSKRSSKRAVDNMAFLEKATDKSDIPVYSKKKVIDAGMEISGKDLHDTIKNPLSNLTLEEIERLVLRHTEMGMPEAASKARDAIETAYNRLLAFEDSENRLKRVTAGSGISDKAEELKELAKELGSLQAEAARLKGQISQHESNSLNVEKRIDEIRQREDSGSLLNRRISMLTDLQELTDLVTRSVRESFSQPLEESFREGFELLSRKSGRISEISINPTDYSTHLSMAGFDGNWLDRDLSATERQHVGLALVYALRRASTEWALPLPVVIDTPTSRMDSEHKSWSVTRFYPKLSQQVIVLATSDDLSGGLFNELSSSGVLGAQILIREKSENSVEAGYSDLAVFFGGN